MQRCAWSAASARCRGRDTRPSARRLVGRAPRARPSDDADARAGNSDAVSTRREAASDGAESASTATSLAPDPTPRLPFPFLAGTSAAGAILTGYLSWSKLAGGAVACPVSSCSDILSSPYSMVGPVPLAVLGCIAYSTVAAASVYTAAHADSSGPGRLTAATASSPAAWAPHVVLYGSSVLAGTSLALIYTLRTVFPDQFCAYCTASALASIVLYLTCLPFWPQLRQITSFGTLAATTLGIVGLFATYPQDVAAGVYDVPFSQPAVTASSPPGAKELAAELRAKGARMYGAFWCSHCFDQKQAFGLDAVTELPYVECYPDGYQGPKSIARACTDADIQGFPTWVINGKKTEGEWPLEFLKAVLDGADPRSEAKKYQ